MKDLKGLLIAGVIATAIMGLPAYSDNARVSRSENLQKREDNSTDRRRVERVSEPQRSNMSRPAQGESTSAPASRPVVNDRGSNARRPGYTDSRPSKDNDNGPGSVDRPSNSHRPSDGGGHVDRPSNSHDSRPSNGGGSVDRPSNSHRPSDGGYNNGYNDGYRPSHNGGYRPGGSVAPPNNNHPRYSNNDRNNRYYHHGRYVAPPVRPYRPYCRPIPRPVPGRYYNPYASARYIDNILGLTFGISYIASLDYLYDNGYTVDGYDSNIVYLRNVNEMSYTWPDATLNYNNVGQLENMQFVYSTSYGSTSRYDRLYRDLCRYYGDPVTYTRTREGFTGVWYGGGQRNYVSLEYDVQFINGSTRYYTILSYGY